MAPSEPGYSGEMKPESLMEYESDLFGRHFYRSLISSSVYCELVSFPDCKGRVRFQLGTRLLAPRLACSQPHLFLGGKLEPTS